MGHVIDYNELWKLYYRSRHSSRNKNPVKGEFWDDLAEHYDRSVRKNPWNTDRDIIQLDLNPDHTVLDIGAGNGRLSVPLAQKVKWVTAVEPSSSMIRYLERNMKEAGLVNYDCIQNTWEETPVPEDTGTYDLVISAFALDFFDLQSALEKMDQAASEKVYIFWFAGRKHDDGLVDYIRGAGGKRQQGNSGLPDYIFVLNILHDMGIYADLSIEEYEWHYPYRSIEEAVSQAVQMGRIGVDDRDMAAEYYGSMLKEDTEGKLLLKITADQALISWKT